MFLCLYRRVKYLLRRWQHVTLDDVHEARVCMAVDKRSKNRRVPNNNALNRHYSNATQARISVFPFSPLGSHPSSRPHAYGYMSPTR